MNLGGVPPPALYRGYVHAGTRQSRGTPEPPKTGAAEWGGLAPGGRGSARGFAPESDPKRTQKNPKIFKNQPQMEALGPRVCGGGGGGGISPLSQLRFAPSTFVFGVNFWFLAAPSSRPINIYIYIYLYPKMGGWGLVGGDTPTPTAPQRNQTAEIQSALKPSLDVTKPAGARQEHGPGTARGAGGNLLLLLLLVLGGSCPPPRLDEGDPYGNAGRLRPLRRVLADQVLHHRVFGHVLHQIGLRGVGTATHAAAIGLGVLDGMCRQVDLQRGRVRVRPVAVGALVGLVLVVLALVGLEVGELGEGLLAAGVRALVGSVAGVDSGVLLEVGQLAEGLLAVGAVVGFDAQVDAQVLGQVGGVGEGLGAVGALVGLGLCV